MKQFRIGQLVKLVSTNKHHHIQKIGGVDYQKWKDLPEGYAIEKSWLNDGSIGLYLGESDTPDIMIATTGSYVFDGKEKVLMNTKIFVLHYSNLKPANE